MENNRSDIMATCVTIISFVSGLIALILYCVRRVQRSRARPRFRQHRSTAARLPRLILFENMFYVCFLMFAVPLMILFWYFLPAWHPHAGVDTGDDDDHAHHALYSTFGYVVFLVAFTPILQVHLVRIWLLQLRYHITSLSMQNQLGFVKWSDVRQKRWTRIYYQHKWTHDMPTLLGMAVAFDVALTIVYFVLIYWNVVAPWMLSGAIFSTLSFTVVVAIVSLRSLQDPFRILAEEFSILLVWIAAIVIYGILYAAGFASVRLHEDPDLWTFVVCLIGSMAALASILVHFYFDNKSLLAVRKNLPPLQVIVSTKEGLETFLRFLVTEFSVENLEFFTLTMRWRHRLVKRDYRRQRRKTVKPASPAYVDVNGSDGAIANGGTTPITPASPDAGAAGEENGATVGMANTDSNRFGLRIEHPDADHENGSTNATDDDQQRFKKGGAITMAELLANPDVLGPQAIKGAPNHQRHKRQIHGHAKSSTQTHLRALPFPILTFEFLDHDVPKQKEHKKPATRGGKDADKLPRNLTVLNMNRTFSDTAYVPEFSQTSYMQQQHGQKLSKKRTMSHSQMNGGHAIIQAPSLHRETVVSVFFSQYGYMEQNKRRLSEFPILTRDASVATPSHAFTANDSHHTPKTYMASRTSGLKKRVRIQDGLNKQNSRSTMRSKLGLNRLTTQTPTHEHEAVQDDSDEDGLANTPGPDVDAKAGALDNMEMASVSGGSMPTLPTQLSSRQTDPNYITPFMSAAEQTSDIPTFTLNKQKTTQIYGQGELKEAEDEEWDDDVDGDGDGDEDGDGDGDGDVDEDGDGAHETAFQYNNNSKAMIQSGPKTSDSFHDHNMQTSNFFVERLSVVQRNSVHMEHRLQQISLYNRADDDGSGDKGHGHEADEFEDELVIDTQATTITQTVTLKSRNNNHDHNKEEEGITPEKFNFFDTDDGLFSIVHDEDFTEEFMRSKTLDYERLITLCADINVSHNARKKLQNFFNSYPTVRKFQRVEIAEYDTALEDSWKDVWQNLNDSLRRFHQSAFYGEWLSSNAANGLNVVQ